MEPATATTSNHWVQDTLVGAVGRVTFPDIFEWEAPNSANGTCPTPGFKPINAGGRGCECLRLRPGSEVLAAFFETRRCVGPGGGGVGG